MDKELCLHLRVKVDGEWWKLYCITYRDEAEDKTRSAYTHARSFEHAHVLFADMCMTGQVTDCLGGVKK